MNHSIMFDPLYLRVIEWMDWQCRFTVTTVYWNRAWRSCWWLVWRSKDDSWWTLQLQEHIDNAKLAWIDWWMNRSSFPSIRGDKDNFETIGSMILESIAIMVFWCRYPSIIMWWNPIRWWLLQLHVFPPIFKYVWCHLITIRFSCSRISHQKQKQLCEFFTIVILFPISTLSLPFYQTNTSPLLNQWHHSINSTNNTS